MDTIGEFLTRIRNAGMAKHEKVDMPASKMRQGIARVLKQRGFIRDFRVVKDSKQGVMRVYLKYGKNGEHAITKMYRVSRPGIRRYFKVDEIPQVRSGFGVAILSTNQGILSGEEAADKKVGGELLCKMW